MVHDLIYDIGMHTGKDTDYYLKKGFRVVAVEANAELVRGVEERLAPEIRAGRLQIYNVAISETKGTVPFYVNDQKDDWGTLSRAFVERNVALGTSHREIEVLGVPLDEIIRECGVPYYAKIDIEGADLLCLKAFHAFEEKPRYVSIESSLVDFREFFTELSHLWVLGYRRFKIVNQALHPSVRCPSPPLEGRYVDQRFDGHMSGPFGEETPGEWLDVEMTIDRYREILAEQRELGAGSRGPGRAPGIVERWRRRRSRRGPAGWYDLHGRLAD